MSFEAPYRMLRSLWRRLFGRGRDIADLPPHVCNFCHDRVNSVWTLDDWFVCDVCYNEHLTLTGRRNQRPVPPPERNIREDGSIEVTPSEAAGHTHAITVNVVGPPPDELARMAETIARVTAQSGVSAREAMQQMGQAMSRTSRTMRAFESAFQGRPMLECTENGEHNWISHEDVATMEVVRLCDVCGLQERMTIHEQETMELRHMSGRVERVAIGGTRTGRAASRGPGPTMQVPRQGSSAQPPAPPPAPNPFVQLGAPRKRPVILDD